MLHKLKACGSSRQKETKKAFCSTEPSNSSSKALSWPTLPSLYDGCASRPDQPEVTPGATVNPQPCSCHARDPRRGSTTFFFTLDALTLPSLPSGPGSAASTPAWLCAGYSGVCSWRALPAAAPQSRLGGSFPLPSHGGEVSACGTAAATEPPGSPRAAGGSRASRRSRAVPRAAQSHSTACCPPAALSLPFRVPFTLMFCGGSAVRTTVFCLFCFCRWVITHTQSPQARLSSRTCSDCTCCLLAGARSGF